uniref:Uncharacterized protein n=1 Tax=Magallana gigas TaxID=29159 RepID=K1QI89_MAGGI
MLCYQLTSAIEWEFVMWALAQQQANVVYPTPTDQSLPNVGLALGQRKPLAAERIPWKRKHTDEMMEDPRKDKYLKHSSGYSSYIYNCMDIHKANGKGAVSKTHTS